MVFLKSTKFLADNPHFRRMRSQVGTIVCEGGDLATLRAPGEGMFLYHQRLSAPCTVKKKQRHYCEVGAQCF